MPPADTFWQRYSPHHEFPLSCTISTTVYGLILGLMIFAGLGWLFFGSDEVGRPPSMDVVQLPHGTGLEGMGAEPGVPGATPREGKTEAVPQPLNPNKTEIPPTDVKLADVKAPVIDVPTVQVGETADANLFAELVQEADQVVKQAMKLPPAPPLAAKAGQGGKGGAGGGPGLGTKGQGTGIGGGGRQLSRQEIYALRWKFDLSGNPREHADKLAKVGFIVAIADQRNNFFVVRDLKRRPAQGGYENLEKYRDAVKYFNVLPQSVQGLGQELRLPFVPRFVVFFLPKSMEEKMAAEEARHAQSQGRKEITETEFDFRLVNGVYEPVVIRQH